MPCLVLNDTERVALEVTYSATLRGRNQRLRERWESIILRNMWRDAEEYIEHEPVNHYEIIMNISMNYKHLILKGSTQKSCSTWHAPTRSPFWDWAVWLRRERFATCSHAVLASACHMDCLFLLLLMIDVICSDLSLSSLLFYITLYYHFHLYHLSSLFLFFLL